MTTSSPRHHCRVTTSSIHHYYVVNTSSLHRHCSSITLSLHHDYIISTSSPHRHCILTTSSLHGRSVVTTSSLNRHYIFTASSLVCWGPQLGFFFPVSLSSQLLLAACLGYCSAGWLPAAGCYHCWFLLAVAATLLLLLLCCCRCCSGYSWLLLADRIWWHLVVIQGSSRGHVGDPLRTEKNLTPGALLGLSLDP